MYHPTSRIVLALFSAAFIAGARAERDGAGGSVESSHHHGQAHVRAPPGLRPEFDKLLGESVVRDFLVQAWSRPVTEFYGTPPYRETAKRYKITPEQGRRGGPTTDLLYEHNGHRFDALGPVLQCPAEMLHVFGTGDAEKRVCGYAGNHSAALPAGTGEPAPCVIISIGSANVWAFELAIAEKLPHCKIHTLDCTVNAVVPAALKHQATFHKVCIGTDDEDVKLNNVAERYSYKEQMQKNGVKALHMVRWETFMRSIGLDTPPDVLKMDIEGYEWSVLTEIASNSPLNMLPKSISLELHYAGAMPNLGWYGHYRSPYEIGAWMDHMFTRGGYVLVDRNDNPFCPHCSEIVIALITGNSERLPRLPRTQSAKEIARPPAGGPESDASSSPLFKSNQNAAGAASAAASAGGTMGVAPAASVLTATVKPTKSKSKSKGRQH